ncbi:MAG: hypothetical protein K1X83_00185 [Oligoflexia bacterium]|nr:hypothetical protein [Oligoflexia bacterium]
MGKKAVVTMGFIKSAAVAAGVFLAASTASAVSISVSWNAVTKNADGSNCTDLRNYSLKYGQASHSYATSVNTALQVEKQLDLNPGFYCFTVTAFDTSNNESAPAPELCVTITDRGVEGGPLNGTRGVGLDFSGSGKSSILTVEKAARGPRSDLNFNIFDAENGALDSTIKFGKFGDVPAPGDYNGDGISELAVVTQLRNSLQWRIRSDADTTTEYRFGHVGDTIVAGCNFDSDVATDLAVVARRSLKVRKSADGSVRTTKLANFPEAVSAISCFDSNNDGIDELVVVGQGPLALGRGVQAKAVRRWKLLVYNALSGKVSAQYSAQRPRVSIVNADLNNDGQTEAGLARAGAQAALNFYLAEDSSPVPVTVAAFSRMISAKIGDGAALVPDSVVLSDSNGAVSRMSLSDLSSTSLDIVLDKSTKERLVGAINSNLGQ